jgi:hypothetical protein
MACWHADLQEYDFEIQYIPGKTNTGPDILFQPFNVNQGKEDNKDVTVLPGERFRTAIMAISPTEFQSEPL